jgi:hypothetical protein
MCHLHAEVATTSKPRPGSRQHTCLCDADLHITEGDHTEVFHEALTIHHPRGWMGVSAAFDYDLDSRDHPSFEDRVSHVRSLVLAEFPEDELISVFLLGTGEPTSET